MSRPLRIEHPGTLYHITARGNSGQLIFFDEDDKDIFLSILLSVLRRYSWRCYAFCLMGNHYHLVIETTKANLSRGMRQLNGTYAQRFNKKAKRYGHLFQGRFKAYIIEEDRYMLAVLRYVVLNPVRAGLCAHPQEYRYSSYLKTAGPANNNDPVDTAYVLRRFGATNKIAVNKYRRFILEGIGEESVFNELKAGIFLGSDTFVGNHTVNLRDEKLQEIPQRQRPDPKPGLGSLVKNEKDKTGIITAYLDWDYSLTQIADYLNVHYSTISRIVKKYELDAKMRKCKT